MDCRIPSFILCEVNNSLELQAIVDSFETSWDILMYIF